MNKKGATLGEVAPAVLFIVFIGVLIGVGMFVMTETQDALGDTYTINNETVAVNGVSTSVAEATRCGFDNFAILRVTNTSTSLTIDPANYTINADTGTIVNVTADPDECPDTAHCSWNVTYTYTSSDDFDATTDNSCDALTNTVTGLGNFSTWMTVIVVVLAASIVLGLVLSSFGKQQGI